MAMMGFLWPFFFIYLGLKCVYVCVHLCVCACVYLYEREGEKQGGHREERTVLGSPVMDALCMHESSQNL